MKPGFQPPTELDASRFASSRLYRNRQELIRSLSQRLPRRPSVVEVGVGLGDFSEFLIETLSPVEFVAIDLFEMHDLEMLWGRPSAEVLGGRTHAQFYRDRFSAGIAEGAVRLVEGLSWNGLDELPRKRYDLVYVDAGHDEGCVTRDLEASLGCLAPRGVIVANDYTLYDPFLDVPYGVVQAVNRFVQERDFVIDGFALEPNMFCDVAISRRT